jgi:hypothetical protein
MRARSWNTLALVLLLFLEFWLFSGSFNKFFNHDSLFYVLYSPRSWEGLADVFSAPDEARNYRPLSLALMGLVVPFFGTNPYPYHWIPIVLHGANTLLLYAVARRLLPNSFAALLATAFWGLHSVASWINYDATCVSDLLACLFLLGSLALALRGRARAQRGPIWISVGLFVCALLTKESAVAFPLAVLLSLSLASISERQTWAAFRRELRAAAPLTFVYAAISLGFAALLFYFLASSQLYAQGAHQPYDIDALSNWQGKLKYFGWALNLPELQMLELPGRGPRVAFGLICSLWLLLGLHCLLRKARVAPAVWSGLLWLAAMNLPAFLLANRVAKWYLYFPLVGLALSFGLLTAELRSWAPRARAAALNATVLAVALIPVVAASKVQADSYLRASDAVYVSDLYETWISDFRARHPSAPARVMLFFLPPFEKDVATVLSRPPVNQGELYELFYPGTEFDARFSYKGDRLPADFARRSDVFVLYHLDGRLHDVTQYYKAGGNRLHAHVLPTLERRVPPLLEKEPAGGRGVLDRHVSFAVADSGAALPQDYFRRPEIWILQYVNGHFTDVTQYYKGRRMDSARRLIADVDKLDVVMDPGEFYPDYSRFQTPNGAPVFFSTPLKDIVTQIGGAAVSAQVGVVPANAVLRFDLSWMYDTGDGGWAELHVRSGGEETSLFRKYMHPNPKGKGFRWEEHRLDLQPFTGRQADIILKCYNEPGNNTVSDWLNWRDLSIETAQRPSPNP